MNKESSLQVRAASWDQDGEVLRAIRRTVFIEEQGVPQAIEWDGRDPQCRHVLALRDGKPVGCGRLMSDGKIGRMAVLASERGHGVGAALLEALIEMARDEGMDRVYLHAQQHAAPFYRQAGFSPRGGTFEEAGIPHVTMHLDLRSSLQVEPADEQFRRNVTYPAPFDALTLALADSALRSLYILSPTLDPRVFDNAELAEAIIALAKDGRRTEIHILVQDTQALVHGGHSLLALARRLPSKVQLRSLAEHPEWRGETVVIRDRNGVLTMPADADRGGFYEPDSRASAQRYVDLFLELWRHSVQGPELRQLSL